MLPVIYLSYRLKIILSYPILSYPILSCSLATHNEKKAAFRGNIRLIDHFLMRFKCSKRSKTEDNSITHLSIISKRQDLFCKLTAYSGLKKKELSEKEQV